MSTDFRSVRARAAERKGGERALAALLPSPKPAAALIATTDDRWLAGMTRCVFQAGFNWKVVNGMWPGFEEAFEGFDPRRWSMMSDDDLDRLVSDTRIVRHGAKIRSVQRNASLVCELSDTHGGAGTFFANSPPQNFVGLLDLLKTRGNRLGGQTAQYFLRSMGVDGFLLSKDGVAALIAAGVIDQSPTSKAAMAAVQGAYDRWSDETGLPLMAISRILGLSIGENVAGIEATA
ncbi:MAG: DNA-3-methyladenine glycosylase I [Pseudomonadota bacterium]